MSPLDALRHGAAFTDRGYATTAVAGTTVVIVDPCRHPLAVWVATGPSVLTYSRAGRRAGVIASNGPLMGRRLIGVGQVTKRTLVAATAVSGVAGALAGGARTGASRRLITSAAGGMIGSVLGAATLLRRWEPCGQIVRDGRRSLRTFDDEGPRHSHLASVGAGFEGLVIGDGHPPDGALAGMGGLVRLVRGGVAVTTFDGDGLARGSARPAVGWGLVPTGPGEGLVVVAGGSAADGADPDLRRLAELMVSLGVVDAVATDPSGCAMLSTGGRHLIRPPAPHRRAIQRVGLCCGPVR
ncbi:MAG: hypothetical protein ABIR68_18040 [Ilumatobacteraceae bacterium]